MNWNSTETLALAKESCTFCQGEGLRGRKSSPNPCNCVLRAIFRACYARFRYCVTKEKYLSKISLSACHGRDRRNTWGRKDEEYIADFCLVSQRTLDEFEHKVFRFHFLLSADWRLCCRKMGIDRGTFFHAVYRIQQKLGRVFRELEPYSLYPLDEYFGGTVRGAFPAAVAKVATMPPPEERRKFIVQHPMLKSA
ncbi:MAG: hypothetical protein WD696_19795 [Bryobacteraceae bacterium]